MKRKAIAPGRALAVIVLLLVLAPGMAPLSVAQEEPKAAPATSASEGTADLAWNVEFVGQIGGASYAVEVQGDYAYAGVGPSLVILDITNPTSPIVAGKTPTLPELVEGVDELEEVVEALSVHG